MSTLGPTPLPAVVRGGACDCATADELLEKLSPLHAFWADSSPSWVFRGVGDDGHKLLAKAHRRGTFNDYGAKVPAGANADERERIMRDLLNRFREALDRAGLEIPSLSPQAPRRGLSAWRSTLTREEVPLMALAQHVGLPTPLLDWGSQLQFGACPTA